MTDTISNETIAPENGTAPAESAPKSEIAEILGQVVKKDSNRELALIADNPDQSAEILLVRGDSGEPECYWFHVDGGIMSPLLKELVLDALKMRENKLSTDAGIYTYMSTAAGIAACFQSNIPGVKLREAFFGPLDMPLYQFVAECRGWSAHEVVFIKRNRNLAYKYRKACEAIAGGAGSASSSASARGGRNKVTADSYKSDFDEMGDAAFADLEYVLGVDDDGDDDLLI